MDHTEALATNASDRYLLGQLSAAEVDAFEEHYFDCAMCADDVRLGMRFLDGGRRLVREAADTAAAPAPVVSITSRPRWNRWVPAAAAAAILAIPINLGLLMRMQSAVPRMVWVSPTTIAEVETRGGGDPTGTTVIRTGDVINFQLPPASSQFDVRITDASGKIVLKKSFTAEEVVDGMTLGGMEPGSYELVIVGMGPDGQYTEIDRRRVEVKR